MRALRKGWIQRDKPAVDEEPKPYLLWADDGQATGKTATGLAYVPAPKPKLPGHEESYNPPKEYLPTEVSPVSQSAATSISLDMLPYPTVLQKAVEAPACVSHDPTSTCPAEVS